MVGAMNSERCFAHIFMSGIFIVSAFPDCPSCGCTNLPCSEQQYAQVLAPYLQDPRNLFVISSDFCHWGARFGFTFHDEAHVRAWCLRLAVCSLPRVSQLRCTSLGLLLSIGRASRVGPQSVCWHCRAPYLSPLSGLIGRA